MSFAPALPLSGYAGWTLLKRTMPAQTAAFNASPEIKTDEAYFRARIGSVKTAEQLVADRRLLKVALGAFGLEADINNRFFIRKVLEDGTLKQDALANKLADKSYQKLSSTFGFGNFSTPSTQISDFADKIITAYRARSFEAAVGAQDSDMRLALNAERELKDLAGKTSSDYSHDVRELLSWVGLGDRMQARPATLSGGEQQRVAIARAVVARPDLLIADEPTGNVDPEMGARLIRLIAELNRLGTTVLIATHDRALIEATRAREMRLIEGRLVELRANT